MATNKNQVVDGVDTDLHSRALPVYGFDAMNRMRASDVLVLGSKGLGLEIAKNIILSGVKSVTIHDDEPVQIADLSSQFYATEADVGKPRSATNVEKLALLNQYVEVKAATGPVTPDLLKQFKVVVSTNNNSMKKLIEMNEFCRSQTDPIRFIVADTFGLFGVVFCDFGVDFPVNDKDGEPLLSSIITSITNDEEPVVTVHEDKKHGLTDGDFVKFAEIRGMEQLNFTNSNTAYEIRELGPFTFKLLGVDTTTFTPYHGGGVATQVKVQTKLNFKSLAESLKDPSISTSDWGKIDRQHTLHVLYQALLAYKEKTSRVPFTNQEIDELNAIADSLKGDAEVKLDADVLKRIAKTSRGDLCPMAATIGGFAAHEVLKACSSKFTPLQQFLYFDALECLPADLLADDEYAPMGCRYDGQIAVFGKTYQKKLGDLNYFLVGAGALGCEYLKNFAMMGLGCGSNGSVIVTDMDIIEKSNLSRQFLFRNTDIGQLKSTTAALAAKTMNPAFNVHSKAIRVGPDTESTFTDQFWEKLDGVANALDNIQARQYVDGRCVFYKKPLMESGTLGTKGNVQVVKPHLTETYSDSRDPPEKTIPLCTLKNFPNTIEHTLQWARDTFEELFRQGPENVNDYVHKGDFLPNLEKQGAGIVKLTLETVYKNVHDKPKSFEDCVAWARMLFQEYYHNTIVQLLYNFPEDSTDKNGVRFWSGPKRAPRIIDFDPRDNTHLDFVIAAANLRAQTYDIPCNRDVEYIRKVASDVKVPAFSAKQGVKIQSNENDNAPPPAQDEDEERLNFLKKNLPEPTSVQNLKMNPIEFEKDNDENFHIDFITAASNLRARNYKIDEADRHTSKVIAGKITPAIATTTTMITGLASIELYKVIQDKPLDHYKNAFVNLALPFVAFSDPIAPAKKKYYDTTFTVWDNFLVSGNPTLAELIEHFKSNHKLSIEAITLPNGVSFYRSFGMNKDSVAQRMKMRISDICTQFGKTTYYDGQKYQILEILVEDEEGNDPDVPNVVVKLV